MANGVMRSLHVTVNTWFSYVGKYHSILLYVEECPNARPTPNGDVVQSGIKFGDTANYTCHFGYRLALGHVAHVVCQRNGQWTKGPPTCVQS